MDFREASTRPVSAKDAVMQIYTTAFDAGYTPLTSEWVREDIEAVYKHDDPAYFRSRSLISGSLIIFRRLGFSREVMLEALSELELEAEGAIPSRDVVHVRIERDFAETRACLKTE